METEYEESENMESENAAPEIQSLHV